MTSVLILYMSRGGHTARIARRLCEHIGVDRRPRRHDAPGRSRARRRGLDHYDVVVLGAPVLYGKYDKSVIEFVTRHRTQLEAKPNSFFNVSVVARVPEKSTVEGNRYMQKFLQLSPWRPRDLKVIAGKVDYPAWPWLDRFMIRLIMKMTNGPTDTTAVIDYTNWDDVRAYGEHLSDAALTR